MRLSLPYRGAGGKKAGALLKGALLAAAVLLRAAVPARAVDATLTIKDGNNVTLNDQVVSASAADTSGVYVTAFSTLTVTNSTITTSGNSTNMGLSDNYGRNAVALVDSSSTFVMSGGKLAGTGTGANAAFASGGGRMELSNVAIECAAQGARGLMATLGGRISAVNTTAAAAGAATPVIATGLGGGVITVSGGSYTASGAGSPGIYSTGDIKVSNSSVSALAGAAAVAEGRGRISLLDSALSGAAGVNDRSVLLYNSAAGGAAAGAAYFSMSGGSLAWPSAAGPLFYAANQTAYISLSTVTVSNSSPYFLKAVGDNTWGTAGANGARAIITASSQAFSGILYTDSISTISLTLANASLFTGQVSTASVYIDATSTWTVAGESFLDALASSGTITFQAPSGSASAPASYSTVTARSYQGGGQLLVNVYMAGDGTLTDSFVIDGGALSGKTLVRLNVTGSAGGSTTGNGIRLVDAAGGTVTSTYAFTLEGNHVCRDGACYRLVRGGISANPETDNDWFLRTSFSTFSVTGVTTHNGAPLAGVAIAVDGDEIHNGVTNASGFYTFELSSGTYTVTPSLNGYVFSPSYRVVASSSDVAGQNFSAYLSTRAVTGTITYAGAGLAGVTITATGGSAATAVTGADGTYSITVGTGPCTITPSLAAFAFTPASLAIPYGWNPIGGRDFAAERTARYALAGTVRYKGAPLAGVALALTGYKTGSAVSAADGTYAFSLPPGGYTLVPAKSGYLFRPVELHITLSADAPSEDFEAWTQEVPAFKGGPYGYAQPKDGYPAVIVLPSAPATGRVTVRIFSQHGARLVRKLETDVMAGYPAQLVWDCLNSGGEPAGSGIYLAVINGGGFDNVKVRVGVLR